MLSSHNLKCNLLSFATENLSEGQYECFTNFVCFIEKLIVKDFKKISGSDHVYFCLNQISPLDYAGISNIYKCTANDGTIDPVITQRRNLEGLHDPKILEACKEYFKKFEWDFELIKENDPRDRLISLYAFLKMSRPDYIPYANLNKEEFKTTVKNVKKLVIPAFDFEKDNYKHLEI